MGIIYVHILQTRLCIAIPAAGGAWLFRRSGWSRTGCNKGSCCFGHQTAAAAAGYPIISTGQHLPG